MPTTPEILALIPARSGSKSVPDKNVRTVGGRPLLAWSIEQARQSPSITRTIVSTDSEAYAAVARQWGAETPFLRPAEFAGDLSTDLEVFQHALQWLRDHEGYQPQICVHLWPTSPIRPAGLIDDVVRTLLENPTFDSVRTVCPAPHTPYKMWFHETDGRLTPVVHCDQPEAYNLPRQSLPATYLQNACVHAVRTPVITEGGSMTGQTIGGYLMDDLHDIDTERDLSAADAQLQTIRHESGKPLTICFDIDGVLATLVPDNDYRQAGPIRATIDVLNKLHAAGHRIVLCTARGSMTGKNWESVTRQQMQDWGVNYHDLRFGKPAADFYIDDRLITLSQLRDLCR